MPASAQYEAPDPSRTIPSARVLGMGRANTGFSEGTTAIFCNPAGLAGSPAWELTSMSGKFLDEFSYLSLSGVYPTDFGTFGMGFMGSSISGAFATMQDPNSSDEDPVYIIDTSQPPISYTNNVFILSYGEKLSRFFQRFGWEDKISLGMNLKFFSSGLTGDGIAEGDGIASGNEIDLGLMYETPWPWATAGITLQNVLPVSMGGRLRYQTGHEEGYPMVCELGTSFNLIGAKKSLRTIGGHELKATLDYYMHPTLKDMPPTTHIGLEYKPIPMVAIRAGIDQDVSGDGTGTSVGTVNNLTSGVGLNVGGFHFDYAYRQFAGIGDISNNYFSISYSPQIEEAETGELVVVSLPPDKLITFEGEVSVEGTVVSRRVKNVTINGLAPKMTLQGAFSASRVLEVGKNAIVVAGLDQANRKIFSKKFRALRLIEFPDVPRDYWVAVPTSLLAMQKIITGYPDGTFRPEGNITRAEMCTLLMKTRAQAKQYASEEAVAPEVAKKSGFRDVVSGHWAEQYIAEAAVEGVVLGYPDGTFRPSGNITRAEGLAMITRFAGVSQEAYADQFVDVTATHWAAPIISGAYTEGLLVYLEGKLFEPSRQLTRAETVEMLRRTRYVQELLEKDLLNWDTY